MSHDLGRLPFPEQLAQIDAGLASGRGLEALLNAAGRLRDAEPLAYAIRRLAEAGALDTPPLPDALSALFLELSDTGVHRVLRHLERARGPVSLGAVVNAISGAMRALPIERLAAVCLMDRFLKNADPAAREALAAEAFAACREALFANDPARLGDPLLARVPGARLAELDASGGPAWGERLRAFAARVLDVLEAMPKSLSQANAEELLSRRVYTDPGHFLFELLQNAEDAGARRWRVEVGPRRVAVWHDGTPFDAKDVVGVLSIGQTTKKKGQIGFFGVGFKAVYEICERPQVYSGHFAFEIADISIPRRLAGRPPAG